MPFFPQDGWPIGVLAGGDHPTEAMREWLTHAPIVLAADGGANRCHAAGIAPDWVIGDFDSVAPAALEFAKNRRHVTDQSTTDCDKLLQLAGELGLTRIALMCSEGDRPDHTLATFHSALRAPIQTRFILRSGWAETLTAGPWRANIPVGARFSILPLTASRVSATGLEWSFDMQAVDATGFSSVSNRTTSETVELTVESGAVIVFVGLD